MMNLSAFFQSGTILLREGLEAIAFRRFTHQDQR